MLHVVEPLADIRTLLEQQKKQSGVSPAFFFKTGEGQYAEHDQFLGVLVPVLRAIAKRFYLLERNDLQTLLASPFNEERFFALCILVHQYQKGSVSQQKELYAFYLQNLSQVNNWNLVDTSAHLIIGNHLFTRERDYLLTLAASENMWERRISIVATWHFIRNQDLEWTFKIAHLLLNDPHDLIHKAVGWMLREAGKKDQAQLIAFLDQYAVCMPRTCLRYAIEKFPEKQRKSYLALRAK